MIDIVFESIQLTIFVVLFLLLLWGIKMTEHINLRGRGMLIAGALLAAFGTAMDVLDELQPQHAFSFRLGPQYYDLLKGTAGVIGYALLAVGLLLMMHSILVALSAKKNVDQRDERFRFIVENIYDIVFLVDLNFNCLYITPSVEKFRGYTVEEALHQNIREVLTRRSIRSVRRAVKEEILRDRKPGIDPNRMRNIELEFLHRNGTTVWGEVTATFLRDEGGNIIGIQGVNRDITERKKAERAVHESKERFRKSFMLIPEAVTVTRVEDGRFTEFNNKFLEQTGFKAYEVRGKTALELGIWSDLEERERFLKAVKKNGMVNNFEAHIRKKSGEVGIGLLSATTIDLEGDTHLLAITKDITEARGYQSALAESEEKFRSTLEAIGDSVRIINRDFVVTWANDIAVSKYGRMVGKKCYEVIQDSDKQCEDCNTQKTFTDGSIRTREMRFNGGHGTTYALVTCSPIKNRDGEITGAVETFKDITALKEVESRLLNTVHEKESLIKEVHHRVKNNLQAISGLLNIQAIRLDDPILRTAISESQNRILSIAMIHEHLYRHHNMSKIDFTGYVDTLVKHIRNSYDMDDSPLCIEVVGQTVILNPDTAIPCGLILTELVSNCFKHAFQPGQRGKMTVELENCGDGRYSMCVRDNGKGLPPDFDVHTIDSFGMMLVRTFTNLLGGELYFEQDDETVFRVVFKEYEEARDLVFQ